MKSMIWAAILILTFAFAGCAYRPRTHTLRVYDAAVFENGPYKMWVGRYQHGFILKYTQDGHKIFSASAETNETMSMHFIRPWDGETLPQGFLRVIYDGQRFKDHCYAVRNTNGTIELYDSDGDGFPEKRLTVTPEYRLIESIDYTFTTNRFEWRQENPNQTD